MSTEIVTEAAKDASRESGKPTGCIELRNIGMTFVQDDKRLIAVSDVSLRVEPGEFVSVVGPSGCGKSTLLNIVAGFLKPGSGVALMDGETIKGPAADRGVVFQQYSLFPWLKVRENVEFGLKLQGMGKHQRQTKARTLLGLAGLLPFENHYPDQLSGGMKQRVGIVRALATGPRVLLMDEPFGALDSQTRVVMQEILTHMWQQWKTSVLFITHDIEEAIFLSDRVYVMTARPGRIKAEIPVDLPRPRSPSMTASPVFTALHRQLKSLIREESLAAMGGEIDRANLSASWHLGEEGMEAVG